MLCQSRSRSRDQFRKNEKFHGKYWLKVYDMHQYHKPWSGKLNIANGLNKELLEKYMQSDFPGHFEAKRWWLLFWHEENDWISEKVVTFNCIDQSKIFDIINYSSGKSLLWKLNLSHYWWQNNPKPVGN